MNLTGDLRSIEKLKLKKIVIAIDGYSGCGKSTTARLVAQHLNYIYIDSGAMYRAVTLYLLQHNISYDQDSPHIQDALEHILIDFQINPSTALPITLLNGVSVESEIRQPHISAIVSKVSALKTVRTAMVQQQRRMGKNKGIVMDGRDIGTVVFPDAELKIFMTASLGIRAMRREKELNARGITVSQQDIETNLKERDHLDMTRSESPLKQADDAIVIDTTGLSINQQVLQVCNLAQQKIHQYS